MKESIIIGVLVKPKDKEEYEGEVELQFVVDLKEDVVDIYLDDKLIAIADWKHNIRAAFERALEIW